MDGFVPGAIFGAIVTAYFGYVSLYAQYFFPQKVNKAYALGGWEAVLAIYERPTIAMRVFLLPSFELARAVTLRAMGRHEESIAALEGAKVSHKPTQWAIVNELVCSNVTLGRYAAAIERAEMIPSYRWQHSAAAALVTVNLAEALYNVGRWDDAWKVLEGVDVAASGEPVAQAGLWQQRAWIHLHADRADEARAALQKANINHLPEDYRAEHHFTATLIDLAAGDVQAAELHALEAFRACRRPSSVRNAMFIAARVEHAAGRTQLAIEFCERAMRDPYQGQCGPGLLFYGDLLTKEGKHDRAREVWQAAVDRDGESESAELAKQRLSGRSG